MRRIGSRSSRNKAFAQDRAFSSGVALGSVRVVGLRRAAGFEIILCTMKMANIMKMKTGMVLWAALVWGRAVGLGGAAEAAETPRDIL